MLKVLNVIELLINAKCAAILLVFKYFILEIYHTWRVNINLSRSMRKRTFSHVRPTKTDQPALPRSLIRVFVVHMKKLCILGYMYPNAPSDDSNQTVPMRRMIWDFAGCTCEGMLSDVAEHFFFYDFTFYGRVSDVIARWRIKRKTRL